jgi:hypothetical protein
MGAVNLIHIAQTLGISGHLDRLVRALWAALELASKRKLFRLLQSADLS